MMSSESQSSSPEVKKTRIEGAEGVEDTKSPVNGGEFAFSDGPTLDEL